MIPEAPDHCPPGPHDRWTGAQLAAGLTFAAAWLEAQAERLDALNAFPVPDSDTGANMSRTLSAAADAVRGRSESAAEVAAAAAHAAVMASSGNSGLLLSQALSGFARGVAGSETLGADELRAGLQQAARTAYASLKQPVEGTLLTAVREAAEAVAAGTASSPLEALRTATAAARRSVELSPERLPLLREAGVVDAGAEGVRLILEVFLAAAEGRQPDPSDWPTAPPGALARARAALGEQPLGYCTRFNVRQAAMALEQARDELGSFDPAAIVVPEADALVVHLHTEWPDAALDVARRFGAVEDVNVQNMEEQHRESVPAAPPARRTASPAATEPDTLVRSEWVRGRRFAVVTDSTADLPAGEFERLGIYQVSLTVNWDGAAYRDKVDLPLAEFYTRLARGHSLPKTAAPAIGDFERLYRALLAEHEGVLSAHLGSRFSGTFAVARTAAENVDPRRIAVLDSGTTTMCLGWVAADAACQADAGIPIEDAVRQAEALFARLQLYAAVDTLEFLERGGRISKLQALAGTLLRVKPLLTVQGGDVRPLERVRTHAAAQRRLVEIAASLPNVRRLGILHGAAPESARELGGLLSQQFADLEIGTGEIGIVVGTHAGPGVFGFTVETGA